MDGSIREYSGGSDFIFNEANSGVMGTSAQRLAPDGRTQDMFPLSIVLCLSKVSPLNRLDTDVVSRDIFEEELRVMTERFKSVIYATTLEMSDVFSAIDPKHGDSFMIDIDRGRPETALTSYMAESLGATKERLYITAGFTLDTRRMSMLMQLLGRLDSVILPGYIKYFRLYRVTVDGAYLIGNDGELFSSYCRETFAGNPEERKQVDSNDSRYRNLMKIFKRTYCTMKDIRESVQQAFDESYSELLAEYMVDSFQDGKLDAQKLNIKLFEKLKDII